MADSRAILAALAAALLFGASTPFAKSLAGEVPAFMLAGLLYLGSGAGLWIARILRDRGYSASGLTRGEWPWFAGAILSGGIVAPAALMFGLSHTSAADASLLLNLEAVLTAVLAWIVFRENAGARIVMGMALIVAGGAALAWPDGSSRSSALGVAAVAFACLCWAVDNNLTRKVSASDALFIAGTKGLGAGVTNLALGLALGGALPAWPIATQAMALGVAGYGVSLVMFVLALRGLGAARTGAYFSTAPFIGAAIAILAFGESTTPAFWAALTLMAAGVWLHLTERHGHLHTHEPLRHRHPHRHDEHHRHSHDLPWDGTEPHSHEHEHTPITHRHPHYPDLHHRHRH